MFFCTFIEHTTFKTMLAQRLVIISLAVLFYACSPENRDSRQWYKGNLHTHSYWSDGDEYPEMIMDWYKSNGYNFVALSDHNILANQEKWIKVTQSKMYEDSFAKYLEKYGPDWVISQTDSGRTKVRLKTYADYKPRFEDQHFLIIQSEEITSRLGDKPIHMNATNIQSLILPQGGETVTEIMQRHVDAVLKQREETGVPMFPHINHPNFFYGVSTEDIINLHGERFFEVYNGHPMVNNYGDSLHPGTEAMWDMINAAYLKKNQPLLLGLATDDSHNYHQFGGAYSNAGRGWVMVHAQELTASSLISALESGEFYSSTGVTLKEVNVQNNQLHVSILMEDKVKYSIEFVGLRKGEDMAVVLKKVDGAGGEFELTDDILFVRARVISDKLKTNPFHEGEFEQAWTQPVTFQK